MERTGPASDVDPDQPLVWTLGADDAKMLSAHREHRIPSSQEPSARRIVHLCLTLIELEIQH